MPADALSSAKPDRPDADGFEGSYYNDYLHMTLTLDGAMPQLPEGSEGRMLMDNGQTVKIWLDRERGKVSILTELDCNSNIERQLLQAQSQMSVCIGKNRQEILNSKM